MKRVLRRPSPAMVIAIVALIAALGGSAIAGGVITKKKVKKISKNVADQEIAAKAPGLSVAKAKTADSATTANSAKSADSLTTQFWAVVNGADGAVLRSSPGVVSADRQVAGQYRVLFNRDVSGCAYQGTLGGNDTGNFTIGEISVNPSSTSNTRVFVGTFNSGGTQTDFDSFTVLVSCNA